MYVCMSLSLYIYRQIDIPYICNPSMSPTVCIYRCTDTHPVTSRSTIVWSPIHLGILLTHHTQHITSFRFQLCVYCFFYIRFILGPNCVETSKGAMHRD